MEKAEIAIVDEQTLRKRIFIVRGIPVMFDFDLAVISTSLCRSFHPARNASCSAIVCLLNISHTAVSSIGRSINSGCSYSYEGKCCMTDSSLTII